jgi:hypothetical protein
MPRSSQQRDGSLRELLFEKRLVELGYTVIMKPARLDDGVDFCVFTSRGWVGIQIKTAAWKRKGAHNKNKRSHVIDLSKHGRAQGKAYYASKGVNVVAAWTPQGFFLIPINDIPGEAHKCLHPRWFERWEETLGSPIEGTDQDQEEIAQLEMMLAVSSHADTPLHRGYQAGPQTASGCVDVAEATQAGGLNQKQGRP